LTEKAVVGEEVREMLRRFEEVRDVARGRCKVACSWEAGSERDVQC
jgi:hypothetical protein